MSPTRSDQILAEWSDVAKTAVPPAAPTETVGPHVGTGFSLAGLAVVVLTLVLGFAWLGSQGNLGSTGPTSSPLLPSPSPERSSMPTAPPESSADPSWQAGCRGPARHPIITFDRWEVAAGSRIANIRLTNRVDIPCDVDAIEFVAYDSDDGTTLIGPVPVQIPSITLDAHESVTSMVLVSNYCGPTPRGSIGLGFSFESGMYFGTGWPFEQRDIAIAPCNDPSAPGTLEMEPWTPVE